MGMVGIRFIKEDFINQLFDDHDMEAYCISKIAFAPDFIREYIDDIDHDSFEKIEIIRKLIHSYLCEDDVFKENLLFFIQGNKIRSNKALKKISTCLKQRALENSNFQSLIRGQVKDLIYSLPFSSLDLAEILIKVEEELEG